MVMLRMLMMLGAAIATPAMAAPVFLKCDIPTDGKPWAVNFVLDEALGRVAVIIETTGHVTQGSGVFTADKVLVRRNGIEYEISRVDLTVTRTVSIPKSVDVGSCKVEELPKRAF